MTEILLNFEEKRPWRRIFSIIYFLFFPTMLRMMLSRKWYNPMILPPLDDDDNGWRLWSLMSVRPSLPLLDVGLLFVCLVGWLILGPQIPLNEFLAFLHSFGLFLLISVTRFIGVVVRLRHHIHSLFDLFLFYQSHKHNLML